jgi:hypothetical protein
MSDLEDIDDGKDAALDQRRLDRGLGVPGEERREAFVAEHHHDRSVVDVAFRQRGGRVLIGRVQELERRRPIKRDDLARARKHDVRRRPGGRIGQEPLGSRILECDAGMEDSADIEAVEHVDEAGDMILVWVGEHHQVDASCEEGQVRPESAQREPWVWAAVHEHRRAVGRLHEDRVALPDVHHRQVQVTIRTRGDRDREEHPNKADADRRRSKEAGDDIRMGSLLRWRTLDRHVPRRPDGPRPETDNR